MLYLLNFNEAKFIGFTMYTTLVIWIAFVPIYYNSDENVITLSLCISFSAIVALVLLFFPKLYIMLFKPEKNNRSYFTTAKNVRCHIGYMPAPATTTSSSMAVSRHSSHSTSEFSMESPRNHSIDVHYKRTDIATIHNPYYSSSSPYPPPSSGRHTNQPKRGAKKKQKGLFSRLRISKQDKIAANVQEHIRAVRAAEALDRQTARGRRMHASQSFLEKPTEIQEHGEHSGYRQEDTVGLLSRQDTATRRIRIIHLLRRTFGEDLEKLPQFSAIVNCLRHECAQTFSEIATQTVIDSSNDPSSVNMVSGHLRAYDTNLRRRDPDDRHESTENTQSQSVSSDLARHHKINKTLSSDESLLSVAGSVVIEENISSGEDSSQDSGVYKNIIINLSNLPKGEHQTEDGEHSQLVQSQQMSSFSVPPQFMSHCSVPTDSSSSERTSQELVGILKKSK